MRRIPVAVMVAWLALSMLGGAGVARAEGGANDEAYLRKRVRSLFACYEAFGGPPGASRRGVLRVEIEPDGAVANVTVDAHATSAFAQCLLQRIRGWKFPAFGARRRSLTYSWVFVATRP